MALIIKNTRFGPPTLVTNGLILLLDAGNPRSYTGVGAITWSDLSGNGNTGITTNGPTFSSANGGSIVFDGTDDYVTHGNVTSLNFGTGNFTISFWMYPTVWYDGGSRGILDKRTGDGTSGWVLYNDGGGPTKINARFGNTSSFFTSTDVLYNIWQHWTLVRNGSATYWYYNGQQDATGTTSANVSDTAVFDVGRSKTWGGYFKGNISVVAIYNRALSALEVEQNFNSTKSRFGNLSLTIQSNPIYLDAANTSSYPGSGNTWFDISGNGNNGTLTNGPTFDSNNSGSIVFDGTNDYISHGNVRSLDFQARNFTIDFWMRPTAWNDGSSRTILDKKTSDNTRGWVIYNDGGQGTKINARLAGTNSFFSTTSVTVNTWQHWTLVRNGTTLYWYYNGIQDANTGTSSASLIDTSTFDIGYGARRGSYFKGNISVVRIDNSALTALEIKNRHNDICGRYGIASVP